MAEELEGTGVRVNTVEPRAAVHSEGADAHMGDSLDPELYKFWCCGRLLLGDGRVRTFGGEDIEVTAYPLASFSLPP